MVGGTEGFGNNVTHARCFQHGADGVAGNQAGTGGGGLQEHLAAAEFGVDFMRNRAVGDGDRAKLALGGFRSLADGVCHFIGLAEAEAYAAFHVSAHDEGGEGEAAAALDDLGATVDEHNLFSELGAFFHGSFSLRPTASVTAGSTGSAAILAVTAGSAGSAAARCGLLRLSGSGGFRSRSSVFRFVIHLRNLSIRISNQFRGRHRPGPSPCRRT